ncbi:uncharacterized protein LOC111058896 [Nilaparvata lugens]|uniref:uncharacterized protein LOC111058896 n=1 Tax=Nilaparvata lugens TaxID=108931 RepID=UPI00193D03C6|nr:uncharacterized protein LOC111058896 [Nilaparvata lugens]
MVEVDAVAFKHLIPRGSVSPLDVDESKFYQPSRAQWSRVPGRETAWRLRPNSYLWLPAAQLPFPPANFRRHFALLVTLRLDPKAKAEGTVFSLRSRRQQDSYLSVELGGPDAIKVVHSGRNGTQTILVPASLTDGNWHYLALGIQDDSSVRSYVDCRWVSTDILRRNELDTPDDADLVIGYLFSGDLEQLVIVPDPGAVSQQCSATRQPSLDPLLEATRPRRPSAFVRKALLAGNQFPDVDRTISEVPSDKKVLPTAPPSSETDSLSWQDLESDSAEEGSGLHPDSNDQYEVEWSEWSQCVSARGDACGGGSGHQTRSSRCVDTGGWLELCLESGAERTQTRACVLPTCNTTNNGEGTTSRCGECLNGGVCTAGAGSGTKRRPCRCRAGSGGWHCEHFSCHPRCLNGGTCVALNTCSCSALYQGTHCQTPICDPPCENGGQCVAPQQCLCPPAAYGNYCQNFTCRGGCLNGGLCVGPDLCECQNNSTGPRCAEPVCDPACENDATCAKGNICLCKPHTSGTRCHIKKCDYRPVQEPYTRGYRRLVKKHLQAKCETWTWKTCVRTLPEYQTVYKTYYRTVYKCVDQL